VDARRRTVILRDNVSKVLSAQKLFSQLSRLRAQVEVEIDILAVSRNSSLNYGLDLQNSTSLVNFGGFLNNKPSVGTFTRFLTFGAGKTLFGLGITDAAAFATVSRSTSQSILKSSVVMLDGQPATMHIGDRYPIVTSQYVGNTSGGGTVFAPPPTVNFEDLGLVLKVTPQVHSEDEVSLDIEAEYKLLGTGSNNGIPVVSNRKFQGKVRLRDGEWAVLAGLEQETVGDTRTGVAGLADLPLIGRWLRHNSIDRNSTHLILVLKPYLLDLPPWETPAPPFWVGTESRPLSFY
jgi:type II secretory pathway component GspD/PulD (secretin)